MPISGRNIVRFAGAVAALVVLPRLAAAQAAPPEPITFTKHIAPILQRSCQHCHRPGSIAPMSLLTYEDARPWARAIKRRTAAREMPPWFVEKNVGIQEFKDDLSLSDQEITLIARWADGGAPRGNPSDLPPPKTFADGNEWTIGTPDLVVSSREGTLKAVAPDYFGPLEPVPTGLTEDRYVKAVEFREVRPQLAAPTAKDGRAALNTFVVHHAVISAGGGENDSATPERRAGGNFNVVWELGQNATIYPDALGVKLGSGSTLTWDVHLHSVGQEMPYRIDVAFKFHPRGYKPKYANSATFGSLTYDLDIPAGESNVRVDGLYTLTRPGLLLSFEPHLHSSGKRMCVDALYPDGRRETLNCAGYNHNWVKVYYYKDHVAPLLPAGTVLQVTAWYDNTAGNPRVADPRNWKGWGSRSIDDMFFLLSRIVWLNEDEFRQEVATRESGRRSASTGQNQP
jgi:hypothetical protein